VAPQIEGEDFIIFPFLCFPGNPCVLGSPEASGPSGTTKRQGEGLSFLPFLFFPYSFYFAAIPFFEQK
jgi:hypothetical protein